MMGKVLFGQFGLGGEEFVLYKLKIPSSIMMINPISNFLGILFSRITILFSSVIIFDNFNGGAVANFFTLTCPICGGDLKITKDIERFACVYCGKEHIVKRGDGIISIAPVLVNVSKGVDSTASELAMVRLNKELAELKPYLLRANNEANKFLVEMQFRIPAIVGTVVFMLGGILLLIFTDVYLLALLFFLIGIVFIGYTFHLHSNEYRNSRNEAVEKAYMLQTLHNKLRDDYSYHYERANKR